MTDENNFTTNEQEAVEHPFSNIATPSVFVHWGMGIFCTHLLYKYVKRQLLMDIE